MAEPVLLTDLSDGVATLTLNRPEAMNALSKALRTELFDAIERLSGDDSVRVVILTGAGDRAFCAGLDLNELTGNPHALNDILSDTGGQDLLEAIEKCPVPIIGAINGFAVTGGFELALSCDILLASETAVFRDTHALVGVVPTWGLTQRLARIVGPSRAQEAHFSARKISAAEAASWGLVSRTCAPDTLMDEARSLAAQIAALDTKIIRELKRMVKSGTATTLREGLALEAQAGLHWAKTAQPSDIR